MIEHTSEERRYTIRVAAQIAGMHEQSLRMYERRGLIQPERSKGNIRLFSDADIEQIRFIRRLVNELGVNLAGVEVIIQMRRQLIQAQAALASLRDPGAR
ncbi:MerR family transcriptional regulator [Oscillochloris sp. ZM17-4]|uniref:MerR family transcriptional regulator n=1 Tax=Oscillochloris sp. ZM17-4 TaxID=2866714 RepID=UPI001C736C55|nr:MerR family transcriptional regulator [Oscillochloris sp. ZM17-4]MBX0330712.1 MerR family transcriptional regulator [Oscillochloris sp. ZM17-4]